MFISSPQSLEKILKNVFLLFSFSKYCDYYCYDYGDYSRAPVTLVVIVVVLLVVGLYQM